MICISNASVALSFVFVASPFAFGILTVGKVTLSITSVQIAYHGAGTFKTETRTPFGTRALRQPILDPTYQLTTNYSLS